MQIQSSSLVRTALVAAAALAAVSLTACAKSSGDAVLRFSAIPGEDKTELKAKFDPVAKYLSDKLGVPCTYVAAEDYAASVEMFKNGDIHLAWFGGLTGVQARVAVAGARAIVQGAEDPEYYSYFIANKDAGLAPSDDFPAAIADLGFTFGSEGSTSGRLMPEFFIRKFTGKSPADFFKKAPAFSGSHPNTVTAVDDGTAIQVGALSYKTFDKMKKEGRADNCVVVWKTPVYADYNMTAHPELETMFGAGFTDRLRDALIGIDDKDLLSAFARSSLIPAKNEDFDAIEKTARDLGLLR